MNWEAFGAIGEIVGAVAVMATLVYLSLQIRQTNKVNASAVRQGFYDFTARQMLHGTESNEFHSMLDRACMTDQELSSGERFQLFRFFQAVFVGYQCAYFQYHNGALGEEDWNVFRALLRSFWLLPGKEAAFWTKSSLRRSRGCGRRPSLIYRLWPNKGLNMAIRDHLRSLARLNDNAASGRFLPLTASF
jgi:hypothetical protein